MSPLSTEVMTEVDMLTTPNATQQRLQDAAAAPWNHGFMPLLRALSAQQDGPPIGEAVRPQQEDFRLRQQPSLTFAPREIADVSIQDERPHIRLYGLGMLGPNGPLPIHFTEIAKDRLDNRRDATLVNFLDLFHHRYLTQFYRAWAQAQSTAGLDRPHDERFSGYISRLIGIEPADSAHSALPQHARLAAAPHLVQEARHPDGLVATLAHYFGIHVSMTEHVLHWIAVSPEEHTRLGNASVASVLGEGALAGEKVPDRQHKFRLVLGPLSLTQYLRFTPKGEDLPVLIDWVRAFVGFEYEWEVELKVATTAAPTARLGEQERLGWSTWLGDTSAQAVTTGMIFEPEQFAAMARTSHHNDMRNKRNTA